MCVIGEYSGGPNEQQTYVYAKTVLDLMCRHSHNEGKILIIGGGIANFTNVADTFKVNDFSKYYIYNKTIYYTTKSGSFHTKLLTTFRVLCEP